jgi:hypothetical protein
MIGRCQFSASWCVELQNNETKIQKIGFRKRNYFVLIDAENSPESRKLANVSNCLLLPLCEWKIVNETKQTSN